MLSLGLLVFQEGLGEHGKPLGQVRIKELRQFLKGVEKLSQPVNTNMGKEWHFSPTFDMRCDTSRARTRERTRPDPFAFRKKGLRRLSKSAMRSFETVCSLMSKSSSGASSILICLTAAAKSLSAAISLTEAVQLVRAG